MKVLQLLHFHRIFVLDNVAIETFIYVDELPYIMMDDKTKDLNIRKKHRYPISMYPETMQRLTGLKVDECRMTSAREWDNFLNHLIETRHQVFNEQKNLIESMKKEIEKLKKRNGEIEKSDR